MCLLLGGSTVVALYTLIIVLLYSDDELPWLQQLHQSDRELCDDVLLGRVCGEIVESVIPAMTRDVVIDTVNDIVQR